MLYIPGVRNPSASLTGGRWLNIFLGGRATLLMLCLVSILLSQPNVVCVYGIYTVEVGLSSVLAVRVTGFIGRHICSWLYPLSLKVVVRNSSSGGRESWSQRALALCIREVRTDCLLAGW